MHDKYILSEISKVDFEISHKISCLYIEKYDFYATLKFQELLDLRAHMRCWNASLLNLRTHNLEDMYTAVSCIAIIWLDVGYDDEKIIFSNESDRSSNYKVMHASVNDKTRHGTVN